MWLTTALEAVALLIICFATYDIDFDRQEAKAKRKQEKATKDELYQFKPEIYTLDIWVKMGKKIIQTNYTTQLPFMPVGSILQFEHEEVLKMHPELADSYRLSKKFSVCHYMYIRQDEKDELHNYMAVLLIPVNNN